MLKLYGRATSSNVQLVRWGMAELGLAVERLDFGFGHASTKTLDFLAMNPMGLVPVLDDNGLILWESAAILRYLCAEYGQAPFWPENARTRAPLDIWAEWVKSSFTPALLNGLFYPLVRRDPATITPAMIAEGAAALAPLAQMLDARLGQGPWMAGEDFTFADLYTGHLLYRYFGLPFERHATPNLSSYYARLQERPAYRDHVMVSWEPLRWKEPS
jgi:glutathione S-transferase